jgi:hypothetical protein
MAENIITVPKRKVIINKIKSKRQINITKIDFKLIEEVIAL